MGITQLPRPPARPQAGHADGFVTGGAYAAVFLLGLAEGVLGSFQYSRGVVGPVPLGAIGFCLAILVTCALGGWALRGMPGALLPAIGWFVASFGLAMPDSAGSVIIASSTAGEWYLYGGSVAALLGVASAFATTVRRPAEPRRSRPAGPSRSRPADPPAPGTRDDRPPGGRAGNGDGPGI